MLASREDQVEALRITHGIHLWVGKRAGKELLKQNRDGLGQTAAKISFDHCWRK